MSAVLPGLAFASLQSGATPPSTSALETRNAAEFPVELRGAWFPLTPDGREGCRAHRRHPRPRDELDWGAIVSAIMISRASAHHVSDYGEGNFYHLVDITPTAPHTWKLRSRLGIDGEPHPDKPLTVSQLRVARRELRWVDDDWKQPETAPTYFKCSTTVAH